MDTTKLNDLIKKAEDAKAKITEYFCDTYLNKVCKELQKYLLDIDAKQIGFSGGVSHSLTITIKDKKGNELWFDEKQEKKWVCYTENLNLNSIHIVCDSDLEYYLSLPPIIGELRALYEMDNLASELSFFIVNVTQEEILIEY